MPSTARASASYYGYKDARYAAQGAGIQKRGAGKSRKLICPFDLADTIRATPGIEGLTLTGGEPFEQAGQLLPLVSRVRAAGLSVMAFTGFELDALVGSAHKKFVAVTGGTGHYRIARGHADGLDTGDGVEQYTSYLTR